MINLLDSHTHTVVSGHAYSTIDEMARYASEHGIKVLAFTEHGPAIENAPGRIYFGNFNIIPREMYGIRVRFGIELNILDYDGTIDLQERELLKQDLCVASIHINCYEPGTVAQNTRAYENVLKNPFVNIIGHPDDGRIPVDYETLVCAAKENHKLLEVNNHSVRPGSVRYEGAKENLVKMLELCKKYKQPIVMDSDAHYMASIADTQFTMPIIEELGFPEELIVNTDLNKYYEYCPLKEIEKQTQICQ